MRGEIPDYIDELPIVSATPETVEDVLKDLVRGPASGGASSASAAARSRSSTTRPRPARDAWTRSTASC